MKRSYLELLQCAHCRQPFELDEQAGDAAIIETGTLNCRGCGIVVPVERGFPFFTIADLERNDPRPLLGTCEDYELYKRRKFERGDLEMYAAFHPFNESLRATEPLLSLVSPDLEPGDVIVEPWARTGWTAAWLASRFPKQQILALWEGDTSVLGYRGFAHWFANDRRPENLDVMFVHPDRGLPFASASIGAIFSHDCFHRFGIDTFASEMLRIAKPDAPIVLAHVHLSNSEPDPWFDRGGTIRHGRTYRAWLDRITDGTSREGRVWSEGDLFEAAELPSDSPDTTHYNGLILIAKDIGRKPSLTLETSGEERLLFNPMFQLHAGRGVARVDPRHLGGLVEHMLVRHPVYRPRLSDAPLPLTDLDWLIIAEASCGTPMSKLAGALGAAPHDVRERLGRLVENDVLLPVSVSRAMHDLQRFHANQLPPTGAFLDLNAFDPGSSLVGEEFLLSGDEIGNAIQLAGSALKDLGVEAGATLEIGAPSDPLVLIIMLAALALGSDVQIREDSSGLTVRSESGTRAVELDRKSNSDGFITIVESAVPQQLPRTVSGRVDFTSPAGWLGMAAPHFLEAAASLRHAFARPHAIQGFHAVSDWLVAVSGLLGGASVRIG